VDVAAAALEVFVLLVVVVPADADSAGSFPSTIWV
jgi:hypothetical protein